MSAEDEGAPLFPLALITQHSALLSPRLLINSVRLTIILASYIPKLFR